ncbi:MAG TPA: class IV adenylate cyclase [Candidatus Uhrbacteria bacterium]|nr:class IV adenylate cyclase [Candidatus Uhrbacteria bacterium]
MKEIEILVKLKDSKEKTLQALKQFTSHGVKSILDIYFYDPLRTELQPDTNMRLRNCLRLRKKEGKFYLAYKIDYFDNDDQWTYSDEHETSVGDFETIMNILKNLGFRELVRIDNKKYTFSTPEYEIVFEDVQNLGFFLEVEKLRKVADNKVAKTKQEIRQFIQELGLHVDEELNAGKPELMLKQKK